MSKTKSKFRYYSEKKAKRASNHQQILIQKLKRSLNNRTDSEKAWDTEIGKIKGASVTVVCDTCNKPQMVAFEDWQVGKYERTCYICRRKLENAEKQKLVELIRPLLPKDCHISTENDGWKYGSIKIRRDKP